MVDPDTLGSIGLDELAKLLFKYGYATIGRRSLMEMLRRDGFLTIDGPFRNLPTSEALERGLLEIREAEVYNPYGRPQTIKTALVTGAGQVYFIDRYLQERQART